MIKRFGVMNNNKIMLGFIGLSLVFQTACSNSVEQDKTAATIKPVATLQEIMLSVIDPNVDPIWNSVSTVATKDGVVEKVPSTDEEWNVLKNHAIVLIEAANLLQIPDRAVAHAGSSTSIHPVELQPEEVEKLIQENRKDFNNKAINLQNAAKSALVAIKEKIQMRCCKLALKLNMLASSAMQLIGIQTTRYQLQPMFWDSNPLVRPMRCYVMALKVSTLLLKKL